MSIYLLITILNIWVKVFMNIKYNNNNNEYSCFKI